MGIENLMMTIHRVPRIELDTGTDWTAVWTAVGTSLATIAVVLITTIYTAYSFRKTINAQKDVADSLEASRIAHSKAEAVARSRQDWINSLRDAVASFVASGDDLSAASHKFHDRTSVVSETEEDARHAQDMKDRLYSEFTRSLSTLKLHYAKVQLYTNPLERETNELILAMIAYVDAASHRMPTADLGDAVVRVAQQIIKNEWVRVKSMN